MAELGGGRRRCRVAGPAERSAVRGYAWCAKELGVVCPSLLPCVLFFPILQLNHFYLLCVDFKTKRLEIIDNSASTEATRLKYGDTLENVKLLLTEYFTSVGEKFKSIICENLKCIRMPMKWRDTGNEVNCGVYLMRHMESYVGERVSKWDCGLTRGDRLQF
nr:ulp1 protease family, C-terminal catalytic domain-containing protein [Ipomoea batatas]